VTLPNPHGTARAASGHARLGYAGGSRGSPEPIEVGNPERAGILNRQFTTSNLGNRRNAEARNDANHRCHVPAWLFDVLCERGIIVINSMLVNCSVRVPMSDDMTVTATVRMGEKKAEIVVACVSGRRFRCGDKYTLEGKGHRGRHHDHDSHPLEKCSRGEAQDAGLLDHMLHDTVGAYPVTSSRARVPADNKTGYKTLSFRPKLFSNFKEK
jgi:hypothetical protein